MILIIKPILLTVNTTINRIKLSVRSLFLGLVVMFFTFSCDNDDVDSVRTDPDTVAASNLIAYFPFDREPAGGAAVEFSSETIRFVRLIGSGSFVEGRRGNAYQGSTDQSCLEFDVRKVSIFTTLEDFTLACWLKAPASVSGSARIFAMDGGDPVMGNISLTREGQPAGDSLELKLYFFDDSSFNRKDHEIRASSQQFLNNDWFHLAALYRKDSSTMEFYVNGERVFSQVNYADTVTENSIPPLLEGITFRNDISKIYFGAWEQQLAGTPEPWMSYYDGLIDEFRIFNKALSGEELFNLYEAELSQVEE